MEHERSLRRWGTAVLAALALVTADRAPAATTELSEVLYCTTIYKVSADPRKPLLSGGPLDHLPTQPAACSGSPGMFEQRDGVIGLFSQGWRPVSVSHSVAVLSQAREPGDRSELLITMLSVMHRTITRPTQGGAR